MKSESGLFAEVPHELVTARQLKPSVKVILMHCLVRYQTKKDDEEPWTFSAAGIAAETGLSERTVSRHMKPLRRNGVLKLYGTLSDGEREYQVFTFSPEALVALIRTTARTSVAVLRAANGDGATVERASDKLSDKLSDNLSDKMPPKREDRKREDDRREDENNQGSVSVLSGASQTAVGGASLPVQLSTAVSLSVPATIQVAAGSSNHGGKKETESTLSCAAAATIQPSASGTRNITAANNTAGHSGASANRAAGTKATSRGSRGANMPKMIADFAEDILRRWKNGTPCTRASIEVVEHEFWSQLAAYSWSEDSGSCGDTRADPLGGCGSLCRSEYRFREASCEAGDP